jgi:FkbM family methyltransferase
MLDRLPPIPVIRIVDVGAMHLGEGHEAYAKLKSALHCEVVGFEPVPAECAKLQALNRPGHTYLPYCVGDGSRQVFRECNFGATSSLFEPNTELLDLIQNLENVTRVVRRHDVETVRLDDIPPCQGTDFLKVDVQGAELMVLQGAERTLQQAVVVHTEVEFAPLYRGQPLFADIDLFLRSRGFVLHRFANISGRAFKPLIRDNNVNAPMTQALWGDAVYVRDFMRFGELSSSQLLKLAAILHANYFSIDLAALALKHYDQKEGTGLAASYLDAAVARVPPGAVREKRGQNS